MARRSSTADHKSTVPEDKPAVTVEEAGLDRNEAVVTGACLLLAVAFAARGITSSLWLDETATYWVIKDGIGNLFSRVWEWTGASLPYDLTAWVSHYLAPVFGLEQA